ncbi:MAG: hypothetical protein PHN84_12805 [Desulfuromonadaceae bacterium]|nr:hypothetical protein [Desulfuromonadaceae bacterium]
MTVWEAFDDIIREYNRSVDLHGDWSDYTTEQMMAVIVNELMVEAGDAELRGDLHGPHGVICELSQVAVCCIKAIIVLSGRPDMTLAETLRTAGVNSCLEGRAVPASLAHPQDKESYSNSPEGESR